MAEPTELLDQYAQKEAHRQEQMMTFAKEILPRLDSSVWVNTILQGRMRTDLRIDGTVELTPLAYIPDPTNPKHVGSFAQGFLFAGGSNKAKLQEQMSEIVPNKDLHRFRDHRARPAFYRLMNLAPGFMVNFVAEINANERALGTFGREIYLAHCAMSKLVAVQDPGALKLNGEHNRRYLFERTIGHIVSEVSTHQAASKI
jgi:hypothetical protein